MKHAPTATRSVYRHAELDRVLNPKSIAIVGASPRTGSFGDRVLGNLAGFDGDIYLVNSKYERVGEQRCFPSLASLPAVPDCAAVTVARESAEEIVREAARVGAGGVILYASGYAETRLPERIEQQRRLCDIARESGLKILGPNCLGIANYLRRARITFSEYPAPREMRDISVGIASQSGALSLALAQAMECGASVSHAFSAGNQADVDVADLVAYLADEPSCQAIACSFEGMEHPQRLLQAAQIAWRNGKPLLVNKIATGTLGAAAAISHTGSLAGSDSAYRAAFERGGAIVVEEFTGLMEAAAFFAKAPAPKARGIAVIATSGGAAIMAADQAELHGVSLPQPSEEVRAVLESNIPDFGSARNPCDVTGQVVNNPESMWACGQALLSDPAYGALVVPQTLAYESHKPRLSAFSQLSAQYGKITCNVLLSGWLQGPGAWEAEIDPHIAQFRSMDRCFRTLAAWHRRADMMARGERSQGRVSDPSAAPAAARMLMDAPGAAARPQPLTERESKAILNLYGIPTVREMAVASRGAAVAAAAQLGFPLAVKVESPDIAHKTEAGAVVLGVQSNAELLAAYDRIMANAKAYSPLADIRGVLLQPMVPTGIEVVAGVRIDPGLGPLIVVGFGGVLVELLRDSVVDLAPIEATEALRMLRRLKGAALFDGYRGAAAVNLNRLADIIVRLSEFAADQRALIQEADVNPIICAGDRSIAVDALIVRRGL
ncbi:MAG TPA: acetate--CoA ligase family protein [Steroidobacteraceae bacterium]|nr:acetate--CoA ligase family protein [Steroidobacteraceae bacterium]